MNRLATQRYLLLPFQAAPLLLVAIFSVLLRLAMHAGLLGLLMALPAIIAIQTITGSFAQALNPAAIAAMTRRLGSWYLLVVGVAIVAGMLGRAVVLDGDHLAFILRIAVLMLLWLVMFSVLGVLHVRRHEVGFEPEHSPERRRLLD